MVSLPAATCHSIHHAPRPSEEKEAYRAACLTCHTVKSCTLKPDNVRRVAAATIASNATWRSGRWQGWRTPTTPKHRIVRYPGQPLPEVAFEHPESTCPGCYGFNRPENRQTRACLMWSSCRPITQRAQGCELWPLWFRKLNELSKTQPDDATVLNSLARLRWRRRRIMPRRQITFQRALKQGSEEPTTFMNLATALANLGRGQEAERC